ncbi:MAG: LacI family DNA-binding transcriptional regulator [Thiolinea sp.]
MLSNRIWNVPSQDHKKVTLHDVARHAGTSKSTVSLVLQGSSSVSDKTRERVQRSIEETGYVYNRRAAALRQSNSDNVIGIIVNGMNTPYSAELMNHLENTLLAQNILPMFGSNGEQLAQQKKLIRFYMEHKVSGFILCPAPETTTLMLDKLWRNGFPVVQIMREVPFSQFPAVVADNRQGMYDATRHLIKLGHQRIAFLGGVDTISDYHERLAGYLDALNEADLSVPSGYICPILQGRAAGRAALEQVMHYDRRITAVVCFSDLMAYGVLSKARELGFTVGQDLAVVGFDDLADSRLTYPALSTVRVEVASLAQTAVELLQTYIREPQTPVERRIIPATLIPRESCGTPHI